MFCPSCGRAISEEANFCRYCGEKITKELQSKEKSLESKSKEYDVSTQRDFKNSKSNSVKAYSGVMKGFLLLGLVILIIPIGLWYLSASNSNGNSFDKKALTKYTCTGASSQLSILVPFELKDGKTGMLDETISHVTYKLGNSKDFKMEILGIEYNVDVTTVSNEQALDYLTNYIEENIDFDNIVRGNVVDIVINGNQCAKQVIHCWDKKNNYNLEWNFILLRKDNEIWIVATAHKIGEKNAIEFTDHIIRSLSVR